MLIEAKEEIYDLNKNQSPSLGNGGWHLPSLPQVSQGQQEVTPRPEILALRPYNHVSKIGLACT